MNSAALSGFFAGDDMSLGGAAGSINTSGGNVTLTTQAAGRPITLTFQNRSGSSHDFTAKQFFAYSRITAGGAPEGEIELKPYETKSITLIPRAGTYKAHCSHFFHEPLGMSDTIFVS